MNVTRLLKHMLQLIWQCFVYTFRIVRSLLRSKMFWRGLDSAASFHGFLT
jgi:hypothetical protein